MRAAEDGAGVLEAFAADADRQPGRSRWSYARTLGRTRIVVLDVRAARHLDPGERRIVDEREWAWAAQQVREPGDVDHVLLASSLPCLLPPGLHHLEAAIEQLGDGRWGTRAARLTERVRRALNLGHWASFQASFRALAELLDAVAARDRDGGPASLLLLSGDVHHGYLARWAQARADDRGTPVWQIVCSPFRKRVGRWEHTAMRAGHTRAAARVGAVLARVAGVPHPRGDWQVHERPTYRNQVGELCLEGRRARVALRTPAGSDWRRPRLRTLWQHTLAA